jgi:hypothetical protein
VLTERGVIYFPVSGTTRGLRRWRAPRSIRVVSPPNNGMQRTRRKRLS